MQIFDECLGGIESNELALVLNSSLLLVLNSVDKDIESKVVENASLRDAMYAVYTKLEDILDGAGYISTAGDLLDEKQVLANKLVAAAKSAKSAGSKFDPSKFIPECECYNFKKHGDALEYLKKHYGAFLSGCNGKEDYLWRGDIQIIDPALRGALYRNHREDFEQLCKVAGKKARKELNSANSRRIKKVLKIKRLVDAAVR